VTPDEYDAALTALRSEAAGAGRDPDSVEPGVVVFVHVADDRDAGARGADWLSDLYRVPPKAFQRHLVAGSATECAAGLWRYAEAGARQVIVMVAGAQAVAQFQSLRSAFDAEEERRPVGVLAGAARA